jgi:hypothetical protein
VRNDLSGYLYKKTKRNPMICRSSWKCKNTKQGCRKMQRHFAAAPFFCGENRFRQKSTHAWAHNEDTLSDEVTSNGYQDLYLLLHRSSPFPSGRRNRRPAETQ